MLFLCFKISDIIISQEVEYYMFILNGETKATSLYVNSDTKV